MINRKMFIGFSVLYHILVWYLFSLIPFEGSIFLGILGSGFSILIGEAIRDCSPKDVGEKYIFTNGILTLSKYKKIRYDGISGEFYSHYRPDYNRIYLYEQKPLSIIQIPHYVIYHGEVKNLDEKIKKQLERYNDDKSVINPKTNYEKWDGHIRNETNIGVLSKSNRKIKK